MIYVDLFKRFVLIVFVVYNEPLFKIDRFKRIVYE